MVIVNVWGCDLGGFVEEVKGNIVVNVNILVGYWFDFGGIFE